MFVIKPYNFVEIISICVAFSVDWNVTDKFIC